MEFIFYIKYPYALQTKYRGKNPLLHYYTVIKKLLNCNNSTVGHFLILKLLFLGCICNRKGICHWWRMEHLDGTDQTQIFLQVELKSLIHVHVQIHVEIKPKVSGLRMISLHCDWCNEQNLMWVRFMQYIFYVHRFTSVFLLCI